MGNGPQAPPPSMPTMASLTCECKEKIMVRIPKPVVVNAPPMSAIIFTHEIPDQCPKCGAMFVMKIVGIGPAMEMQLQWMKINTQQSAIIPGDDQTLKSTLAANQLGRQVKLHEN